jgi:hypothetical protein
MTDKLNYLGKDLVLHDKITIIVPPSDQVPEKYDRYGLLPSADGTISLNGLCNSLHPSLHRSQLHKLLEQYGDNHKLVITTYSPAIISEIKDCYLYIWDRISKEWELCNYKDGDTIGYNTMYGKTPNDVYTEIFHADVRESNIQILIDECYKYINECYDCVNRDLLSLADAKIKELESVLGVEYHECETLRLHLSIISGNP